MGDDNTFRKWDLENRINESLTKPTGFASGSISAGGTIGATGTVGKSTNSIPILGGQLNVGVGSSFGLPIKGTYGTSYTHVLR